MIKWVLILHLLNMDNVLEAEQVTIDFNWGKQCRQACEDFKAAGQYQNQVVITCSCKKASKFYENMAESEVEKRF